MDYRVVIPARFASQRLPGKPLKDICGKPMIQHVWERAREAGPSEVVVATDDLSIKTACESFGAVALMTSPNHASGTDRIAEAVDCPALLVHTPTLEKPGAVTRAVQWLIT